MTKEISETINFIWVVAQKPPPKTKAKIINEIVGKLTIPASHSPRNVTMSGTDEVGWAGAER